MGQYNYHIAYLTYHKEKHVINKTVISFFKIKTVTDIKNRT